MSWYIAIYFHFNFLIISAFGRVKSLNFPFCSTHAKYLSHVIRPQGNFTEWGDTASGANSFRWNRRTRTLAQFDLTRQEKTAFMLEAVSFKQVYLVHKLKIMWHCSHQLNISEVGICRFGSTLWERFCSSLRSIIGRSQGKRQIETLVTNEIKEVCVTTELLHTAHQLTFCFLPSSGYPEGEHRMLPQLAPLP